MTDQVTARVRGEPDAPRPGLLGSALVAVATIAGKLPAAPLNAAADASGELWYRIAPAKRAQARANLQRVCEGLAATGAGSTRARRAATDPDALERLVRACFRHAARYYVEVARTGGYDLETALGDRSTWRRPTSSAARSRAGP